VAALRAGITHLQGARFAERALTFRMYCMLELVGRWVFPPQ